MFLPKINKPMTANQIICVTRNPCDAIVSNFNFTHSFTHDKTFESEFHKMEPKLWTDVSIEFASMWINFHKILIKEAKEKKVPICYLRYEDLVDRPEASLQEAFRFLLATESIEGKNIERRIEAVLEAGASK